MDPGPLSPAVACPGGRPWRLLSPSLPLPPPATVAYCILSVSGFLFLCGLCLLMVSPAYGSRELTPSAAPEFLFPSCIQLWLSLPTSQLNTQCPPTRGLDWFGSPH